MSNTYTSWQLKLFNPDPRIVLINDSRIDSTGVFGCALGAGPAAPQRGAVEGHEGPREARVHGAHGVQAQQGLSAARLGHFVQQALVPPPREALILPLPCVLVCVRIQ